jgi:hypothetical protein
LLRRLEGCWSFGIAPIRQALTYTAGPAIPPGSPILAQDAPVIPAFFIRYGMGQHPEVKNWTPPNAPYGTHLQLEQVWLEK